MRRAATRVAVTGIGLRTPIGSDVATFWSALLTGRSGAGPVRSFDTSALPLHVGCEVPDFEPRSPGGDGRCTQLAVAAALDALHAAGRLDLHRLPTAGVVVGTTMGEVTDFEQSRAHHPDREPDSADRAELADRPLAGIARAVARAVGARGPVLTTPAACAAGTYAIGLAARLVARGDARAALAVGAEAFSRLAFVGFTRMRAMSAGVCRPFSLARPGLLLGEGAGALLLETEVDARARDAPILGYVEGFGLACDAHHVTAPHPQGEGAARAMRDALRRGGVSCEEVDYVNAHGTGTPLNDRAECRALYQVFGARTRDIPVSSIKALTGHMMGAAGAVEAIATLLALRHDVIPPTWNWEGADPECEIDCVPNAPREAQLRWALSNSYAFGGNDASVLLGAAGDPP